MPDPLTAVSTRRTPQNVQADPRQVLNSTGGYVFKLDELAQIHRFLTIGTTGGTFYASEQKLTADNAAVVLEAARNNASALVEHVVQVSTAGRAPRQNPALFALAVCASLGDDEGRKAALDALPRVARTGTHLFTFAAYAEQFRGWGRGMRRAVGSWYTGKSAQALVYQVLKYRQRVGWTHRDLLRLSHPETSDPALRDLFEWVSRGSVGEHTPRMVEGFLAAKVCNTPGGMVRLINDYGLSWEMLPDEALAFPEVWEALILSGGLPMTAMIRQLPRLTRLGVLTPFSDTTNLVTDRLTDADRLRRARVHPLNLLVAHRTYVNGVSLRGKSTWNPQRVVVDALDQAFYAAYGAVEPAGKRTLVALDISGSMGWHTGDLGVTAREVAAAISLVTLNTEPQANVVGFSHDIRPLSISPRQRLGDVIRYTSGLPFGATDCALAFRWAMTQREEYDTFVVVTDNETNGGVGWSTSVHPHQALAQYRQKRVPEAKLVVVGVTATKCSIADPMDRGSLDIAGFDSAVPSLIANFSRGDV